MSLNGPINVGPWPLLTAVVRMPTNQELANATNLRASSPLSGGLDAEVGLALIRKRFPSAASTTVAPHYVSAGTEALFRLVEELRQVFAPDRWKRMCAVPARLVGDRKQNKPPTFYLLNFPFDDTEFRRVDLIIG